MADRFTVSRGGKTDRRRLIEEGEEGGGDERQRGSLGYGATGIDLSGRNCDTVLREAEGSLGYGATGIDVLGRNCATVFKD